MMLIHNCGAPVEVLEDENHCGILLRFFCKACMQTVYDDHELFVVDALTILEEAIR
jgi:hypothetical protein